MKPQHVGLATGRWQTLSLMEQLANVGSDGPAPIVGRKIRHLEKACQTARSNCST
jgi:hypothetical protein